MDQPEGVVPVEDPVWGILLDLGVHRMPTRSGRGIEMGMKAKVRWKEEETYMQA